MFSTKLKRLVRGDVELEEKSESFKDDEGAPVKRDCPVVRTKSSVPELKSWNASSSSTLQPSDKEM